MTEPEKGPQEPAEPKAESAEATPPEAAGETKPGSPLGSFLSHARQVGRDVLSVTLGRFGDSEAPPPAKAEDEVGDDLSTEGAKSRHRVGMLHAMAEQLRGAADDYVAAKLDEIEARVDQKLDGIEQRIDQKIIDLQKHLEALRDQELRHRLRLLKLTLIFTVLVAVLSLVYKWVEKAYQLP
jgi:hypothetical protein